MHKSKCVFSYITVAMLVLLIPSCEPKKLAKPKDYDRTKKRVIPLKDIYTTFPQPKVKRVSFPARNLGGASNLALVYGKDVKEAVKAAERIFKGYISARQVVGKDYETNSGPVWLVVYLGRDGSNPPPWPIHSITIKGKRIQVFCKDDSEEGGTQDVHYHFAFAHVGKLKPGVYSVELINKSTNQTELIRFVKVQ